MTFTNEDVIKIMRHSFRNEGNYFKLWGLVLFLLPGGCLYILISDIVSGDFFIYWKTDTLSLIIFFIVTILLALPGILLFRKGIRKATPERNNVYNTYINSPQNIAEVADKVINYNGINYYNVFIYTNRGESLRIKSNAEQYRFLVKFIKTDCPNAAQR